MSTGRSAGVTVLLMAAMVAPAAAQVEDVIKELNQPIIEVTDRNTSYRTIFDAYLALMEPPIEIGQGFNLNTIYPGMQRWNEVADWAESNPGMAEALINGSTDNIVRFGLPYGTTAVDPKYNSAGLVVRIAEDGNIRDISYSYFEAIRTIAAYATAESYRLLEAGRADRAFEVAIANMWMARQLADRRLLREKTFAFNLLIDVLATHRDMIYKYRNQIPENVLVEIAKDEYPRLRTGYRWRVLQMPEGEQIVSKALLTAAFYPDDAGPDAGQPNSEKFASIFGALQSSEKPLTRFGAARRWKAIAAVHGSLDASLQKLQKIYDNWWRRWRMDPYNLLLIVPTRFERTNEIRYGAVIYSIQDIQSLFDLRVQLVASENGTALVAGLAAYHQYYDVYPDNYEKVYAQFVRKTFSDIDTWRTNMGTFTYRQLNSRTAIQTLRGQVWAEGALLYSVGANHDDDRGSEHSTDGSEGDWVIWPSVRVLQREAGLR